MLEDSDLRGGSRAEAVPAPGAGRNWEDSIIPWLSGSLRVSLGTTEDGDWKNGVFQCFTEASNKGVTVGTIMVIPGLFMCSLILIQY